MDMVTSGRCSWPQGRLDSGGEEPTPSVAPFAVTVVTVGREKKSKPELKGR